MLEIDIFKNSSQNIWVSRGTISEGLDTHADALLAKTLLLTVGQALLWTKHTHTHTHTHFFVNVQLVSKMHLSVILNYLDP